MDRMTIASHRWACICCFAFTLDKEHCVRQAVLAMPFLGGAPEDNLWQTACDPGVADPLDYHCGLARQAGNFPIRSAFPCGGRGGPIRWLRTAPNPGEETCA